MLVALILTSGLGCKGKAEKEPTVLGDGGWNVDYAKNVCESRRQSATPCLTDPTSEVRDYELQIRTEWAANPICHGLRLVGFGQSVSADEDKAIEFQLMLDYVPGESKQSWTVTNRKALTQVATGTDDPKTTAHTICAVLSHRGGSVE